MTTASEMTTAEAIRKLMKMWDVSRSKWIEQFGNDEGFAEWFSKQVGV